MMPQWKKERFTACGSLASGTGSAGVLPHLWPGCQHGTEMRLLRLLRLRLHCRSVPEAEEAAHSIHALGTPRSSNSRCSLSGTLLRGFASRVSEMPATDGCLRQAHVSGSLQDIRVCRHSSEGSFYRASEKGPITILLLHSPPMHFSLDHLSRFKLFDL